MIVLTLPWPPTTPGIYRITDSRSGRFYIGSAANIRRRWYYHQYRFRRGDHVNPALQNVWNTDPTRLAVSVLLSIPGASREELLLAEQRFLDEAGAGHDRRCMNVLRVAGSPVGHKRSAQYCRALSERSRGKSPTPETRERMRAAKLGKKLSPEHVAKLAAASKGRPGPKHTEQSLAAWRKYTPIQVSGLRQAVASGEPLFTACKRLGIARATARRIVAGVAYVGVSA